MRIELDETDERILRALQPDGRRSFRDVAREIGVSEGTVRGRVRRLEHLGVLRIVAFVDPLQFGDAMLAVLLIRTLSARQQAVIDEIVAWAESTYVSSMIGRADVYVQLVCPSNEALAEIIARVHALEGVIEVELMTELAVHKFSYDRADIRLPSARARR